MTYDPDTADLLDEAADEMLKDGGWRQGSLGDPLGEGSVCAVGAIIRVADRRRGIDRMYGGCGAQALVEASIPILLPHYNDTPGRTAGEMADLFRTVAKSLREQPEAEGK